jgi:hypothetical protein
MASNRWRRLGVAALCALFCLTLLSCSSSKLTQENFDKIQNGMTMAQVKAILGEPTEASSVGVAGFLGGTSKWQAGEVAITIQFFNGKVIAKQFSKAENKSETK